ncbi:thiamine phosphate synthase [Edaphobacter dinghuensis]|uniref:Thiamine-phosphate synthase n=1 Tax=Edaphobacter dinghuensis TaxID=1560005 RepID=A0A917HCP2_9BACT|nr:thiamine phosphate synthase [Edaphobacter dinghuensis]GGG74319.1 thiamine-phosphate synthase [Edaphobacter dinghuensis]
MGLPKLYPILDAGLLAARGHEVRWAAEQMQAGGAELLQYRDKTGSPQSILQNAAIVREVFAGTNCRLILNDRADLAVLADWGGVHVGQGDLSPDDAARVVGASRWVGVSTHNDEQVRLADTSCADYIAVGPVFATGTKLDAEPVIGLDGVRRARALTSKPIVAIGGITRANARSVIEAGADSVALISALFVEGESVEKVARDFLEILG